MDGFALPSFFECGACGGTFVDREVHVRHEIGCTGGPSLEHGEPATAGPVATRIRRAVSLGGS